MKPLMIFSFGGWSASTPLYQTLCKNKVVRKSIVKEPNILPAIIGKQPHITLQKYTHCKQKNREGCEVFSCTSIDDYIEWLLRYHNDEYLGVSDATNTHIFFDVQDISTFAFKFKEAFQVKILIICRDPVKRLFSHLNSIPNPGHSLDNLGQNQRLELVMPYLDKPEPMQFPSQGWDYKQKAYEPFMETNYPEMIENWSQFFDTHVICMEDLWGDKNDALEKLNTFLGTSIHSLTPNVYYPDRGPNAPHYKGLKDQWSSDTEFITKKNYDLAREKLQWVYSSLSYW